MSLLISRGEASASFRLLYAPKAELASNEGRFQRVSRLWLEMNETTSTKGSSMICTLASHVSVMTESVVQSDLQTELNFHHEVLWTFARDWIVPTLVVQQFRLVVVLACVSRFCSEASFCCAKVRVVFRFPCRCCLSGLYCPSCSGQGPTTCPIF